MRAKAGAGWRADGFLQGRGLAGDRAVLPRRRMGVAG